MSLFTKSADKTSISGSSTAASYGTVQEASAPKKESFWEKTKSVGRAAKRAMTGNRYQDMGSASAAPLHDRVTTPPKGGSYQG